MANFKQTLIFNAGKVGWTESWYVEAVDLGRADTLTSSLATARSKLCGTGVKIEAIRTTDVLNPAVAKLRLAPVEGFGTPSGVGVVGGVIADQANAAIRLQASTAAGYKRQVWLRGCPDSWIQRNVTDLRMLPNVTEMLAAVRTFEGFAVGANPPQQIRIRSRNPASSPVRFVTAITENADGLYLITTDVAHVLTAADRVVIRNARGNNVQRALGVHPVVSAPTPTTFVIGARPNPDKGNVIYLGGPATARKLVWEYASIVRLDPMAVGTRKAGRPLGVSRGRARARP